MIKSQSENSPRVTCYYLFFNIYFCQCFKIFYINTVFVYLVMYGYTLLVDLFNLLNVNSLYKFERQY